MWPGKRAPEVRRPLGRTDMVAQHAAHRRTWPIAATCACGQGAGRREMTHGKTPFDRQHAGQGAQSTLAGGEPYRRALMLRSVRTCQTHETACHDWTSLVAQIAGPSHNQCARRSMLGNEVIRRKKQLQGERMCAEDARPGASQHHHHRAEKFRTCSLRFQLSRQPYLYVSAAGFLNKTRIVRLELPRVERVLLEAIVDKPWL